MDEPALQPAGAAIEVTPEAAAPAVVRKWVPKATVTPLEALETAPQIAETATVEPRSRNGGRLARRGVRWGARALAPAREEVGAEEERQTFRYDTVGSGSTQ